jgi:hypothetical protein
MESRWESHREWYAHKTWYGLLETLMPQQRAIKEFERIMKEYDEKNTRVLPESDGVQGHEPENGKG